MAFALNDRVKETSTTTGTGTFDLAGAETGFESFVSGVGTGNSTYYAISNDGTTEFEVGIGTVTDATPDTLSRTTIISSSNSDALVDFSAGTKTVFCTLPASRTPSAGMTAQTFVNTHNSTISDDQTLDSGVLAGGNYIMSKIEVDTIAPQSGTQITLGESGDTITIPAGATFDASSGTLTLADGSVTNAKLANSAITINGSSVSLGGSTTIETGTSWQSTIVTGTTLTAEAGKGYWINTTSNACTITLPASASVGDQIIFTDYARNWATNAVTLNTNSLNFQGGTTNVVYNTNGQSVDIVYSGATKGWIPNVDDDVPNSQAYSAEYLVVAGGASGSSGAGAGGAGGMLSNYGTSTIDFTISSTYTAVVGAGGAAVAQSTNGNDGGDSTLSGTGITTITAFGGGGGANGGFIGRDGGSGGGGAGGIPITVGGSGTVGQGNDGGQGSSTPNYGSGGGGGAGAVGGNGSGGAGGAGGTGLQNAITGTNTYYAGGGTGNVGGSGGGTAGSLGGGGSGGRDFTAPGNGTDGLGGGGGGGGHNTTRSTGGSGVVILRVATANYSGTTTGSPTVTTDGTDTIIKFTGNGTYTA